MKKLVCFENGHSYLWTDSIQINLLGAKIIKEIDVNKATLEEIEHLKKDINNQSLIDSIKKRE